MVNFSVPADFTESSLINYYKLNEKYRGKKITEVYGQITTGKVTASGRMTISLPQITMKHLSHYIKACKKYGIEFNYTLNSSCMGNNEIVGEYREQIILFILELHDIGVSSFTIAMPSLIDIVKKYLPDMIIKASAICEINSLQRAQHYKRLQINRIVLDPDITRQIKRIRDIISVFGEDTEIIVNNVCMRNCAYKMFHYNHDAHCTSRELCKEKEHYYYNKCSYQKALDESNYIKLNWIRPEDLKSYINLGICRFKVQGRNYGNSDYILKVVDSYFSESFDGDLMALLTLFQPFTAFQPSIDNKKLDGFIERFFSHPDLCCGLCRNCDYCLIYAKKSMDMDKLQEMNIYARQLFQD